MKNVIIEKLLRHALNAVSAALITKYALSPDSATMITDAFYLLIAGVLGLTGSVAWSVNASSPTLFTSKEPLNNSPVFTPEPYVIGKGFFLSRRSLDALVGVHPDLVAVIHKAIAFAPYDFTVVEGLRSPERQKTLKDSGASLTLNSKHLKQSDGYGHAVDLYVFNDKFKNGIDDRLSTYSALNTHIQSVADDLGVKISWGGLFRRANGKPFIDGHHWQIDL